MTTISVDPALAAVRSQAGELHTALYVGSVRHRRFDRVGHGFSMRLYFAYLDLAELDRAFEGRWLWSHRRMAPMRFRRSDYFGPADVPLDRAVRDAVQARIGTRPDGAVRLLTNLRCWGYQFNPVSIYYCFDRRERLVAVLAEITNTPWRERHHYVIAAGEAGRRQLEATFDKQFHVSPFQPMEQRYHWLLLPPGEQLVVHMENEQGGQKVFDATMTATRRPWTGRNLAGVLARHPFMTGKVILNIYWHALCLWWKRATFHRHPAKRPAK